MSSASTPRPGDTRAGPLARAAAALGIFALATAIRAAWWRGVFTENGLHTPHGADEFYHLRRIWYAVVNYPDILERDPYVRFPFSGEIVWPPGFDLVVASVARLVVGAGDQTAFEVFVAWVPPVLGAVTAVAAAWIGARVFSPGAGLLAGVLLAILPAHYHFSQLGVIDHHVAVSFAMTTLMATAVAVAQRPPTRPWPLAALGLGLGGALFLLTWAGALLHLALLQGVAAVWMLQARDPEVAVSRARHLAVTCGSCGLAIAPYCLGREWDQLGNSSLLVLGNFHPTWFAATGAASLALSVAWSRTPLGARVSSRWASTAGLALPAVAALVVAVPGFREALGDALGWFAHGEEFYAFIGELRPLFSGYFGGSPTSMAEMQFTRLIYAFPLALIWLVRSARRDHRSDRWLLVLWGGGFLVLTLLQVRFENTFSVPYVIVWAGALVAIAGNLRRRLEGASAGRRVAAVAAAGLLVVVAALPSADFLAGRIASGWRGALSVAPPSYVVARTHHGMARWLRAHSPVTSGYLDASQRPEYGVLVRWDMGHLFRYLSERPMVQDNFGVYTGRREFDAAERYFATANEQEASEILDGLGVRYVVVDVTGSGHGRAYAERSMARRLFPTNAVTEAPALSRHRLLAETDPSRIDAIHVMIYEHVAGAYVTGVASPGAAIAADLDILSDAQPRPSRYRIIGRADPQGVYRIRLAYATDAARPVRTAAAYAVHCGGPAVAVAVPEEAVLHGRAIAAPPLTCGRGE
ncbi:MAG: STT3 domain-containing protein [Myxococcota bacterium]